MLGNFGLRMLVRQRRVGCVAWDGLIGGSETGGMERVTYLLVDNLAALSLKYGCKVGRYMDIDVDCSIGYIRYDIRQLRRGLERLLSYSSLL